MNAVRVCMLALTCGLSGVCTVVHSDSALPESTFLNWSGVLNKASLSDGSSITEYAARTFSRNVDGAMLAVSFVPRFNCAPIVTVRLPEKSVVTAKSVVLEISVGNQRRRYNGYIDADGNSIIYSLVATTEQLEALVRILDVSSSASVRLLSRPAPGAELPNKNNAETVEFSLLGSQLSTMAVEKHCRMHRPEIYEPMGSRG